MSLVNDMLRELDKRNAPQGALAGGRGGLAQNLRPVRPQRQVSRLLAYLLAVVVLGALGWAGWSWWQPDAPPAATPPVVLPAPQRPVPATAAVAEAAPGQAAAPVAASAVRQPTETARTRPDTLRLAMELTTPIGAPRKRAGATAGRPTAPSARDKAGRPRAAGVAPESAKISRSASTPEDRANEEYQRALNLIDRGRMAEGMEGLRAALRIDSSHPAARQTLVALLTESRRFDEAASLLREGLAGDPKNAGFAMMLARIAVERNDISGALDLLQRHAEAGAGQGDYHAFMAALYQRLGKHREAIGEYQTALRLAPGAGAWWMGLGISSQATKQPRDALEAFRQAKASGTLTPDLTAFVDQRLRELQ